MRHTRRPRSRPRLFLTAFAAFFALAPFLTSCKQNVESETAKTANTETAGAPAAPEKKTAEELEALKGTGGASPGVLPWPWVEENPWEPLTGDEPAYSSDWVSSNTANWEKFLGHLKGKADVRGVEIGSFEGRSAVWFAKNILTGEGSKLICIDPFSDRLNQFFDHNIRVSGIEDHIVKMPGYSQELLRQLPTSEPFDFIYVDGCHLPTCALADMVLGWDLLKVDGVMIVDDYQWVGPGRESPGPAVDAFLQIYGPLLEVAEKGRQAIFVKKKAGY